MDHGLTTPNYCLNYRWFIIKGVLWYSAESNFTRSAHENIFIQKWVKGAYMPNNITQMFRGFTVSIFMPWYMVNEEGSYDDQI